MIYVGLADLIMVVHLVYMAFVVFGLLLIPVGAVLRWRWVRNPWFRWLHLTAIGIVAVEAIVNVRCPLSDWEDHYRNLATASGVQKMYLYEFLGSVLHWDAPWDHWGFKTAYVGVALLVVGTLVLVPPGRPTSGSAPKDAAAPEQAPEPPSQPRASSAARSESSKP